MSRHRDPGAKAMTTTAGYLFLGLTAIVGALVGLLVFAVLRLAAATRAAKRGAPQAGGEAALMATAMQEAVARVKAREQATHARAEASERLSEEILANMTAGLLVVDADEMIRVVNPAGRRLLGRPEVTPPVTFRALGGPVGHALAGVLDECLTRRAPLVRRAIGLAAAETGGVSQLGVTVSPILDRHDGPGGAICLFTDLSEVAELEERLRLKESLASLGELTAGIAHEFRNGLATIHGHARLFDLDRLSPEDRRHVDGIRQETEALRQVVTSFLDFARPSRLSLAPVDLALLVAQVADEARTDAGVDIQVGGEFGTVMGDPVLLRQVLTNLVRNALEACVGTGVAPLVSFGGQLDRAHQRQRLDVCDNGRGIEPSVRDRVFQPFFTTKPGGTGLGLAVVQKIVVEHDGRIWLHLPSDGGTCVCLALPLVSEGAFSVATSVTTSARPRSE